MRFLNIFILVLVFSFSQNWGQDSNTVNYSLFLEKSVSFGTVDTKIDEGTFKEGETFLSIKICTMHFPVVNSVSIMVH